MSETPKLSYTSCSRDAWRPVEDERLVTFSTLGLGGLISIFANKLARRA